MKRLKFLYVGIETGLIQARLERSKNGSRFTLSAYCQEGWPNALRNKIKPAKRGRRGEWVTGNHPKASLSQEWFVLQLKAKKLEAAVPEAEKWLRSLDQTPLSPHYIWEGVEFTPGRRGAWRVSSDYDTSNCHHLTASPLVSHWVYDTRELKIWLVATRDLMATLDELANLMPLR